MNRVFVMLSFAFFSALAACGGIDTAPPDGGHTESSSTSTAHGGSGGQSSTSTSTGGSGGQTTTTVQCADPENPKAPCIFGFCPGTCSPPAFEDGGITPGTCHTEKGCEPACFLNVDCPSYIALPGTCKTVRCDPTGKMTALTSPMIGCYLSEAVPGTACEKRGGLAGVCMKNRDGVTCVTD